MSMLDLLIVLLIVSWFGGFSIHVGGDLIHILLAIALVMAIFRLAGGRRA